MRIRRLLLTRFGHFEDAEVDFGPRTGGAPDFHVVYGLNEAGKTTFLNAILRLLYGFNRKGSEPYDFRHGANLEVGAEVEGLDGGGSLLVRRVKASNALIDAEGRVLPPTLLDGALAGLGQEEYRRIFSLDRESVEAGAEDIRNAGSEASRLLFAAHAGLSSLSASLEDVERRAGELFKERGSAQKGARLKRRMKEIDREIREADIPVARYEELARAVKDAAAARDAALREAVQARRAHEGAALLIRIREDRGHLAAVEETLARDHAGCPDWTGEPHERGLSTLNADAEKAATEIRLHTAAKAKLEARRAALDPDEAVLALESRLAALDGETGLRSLAEGALRDLGRRRDAQKRHEMEMRERLAPLLVEPAPEISEDLLLPADAIGSLRKALEALRRAETAAGTATRERERAEKAVHDLEREEAEVLAASPLSDDAAAALDLLDLETVEKAAAGADETLARLADDAGAALDALQLAGRAVDAAPETELTASGVRAEAASLAGLARDAETKAEAARALAGEVARRRHALGELEDALGPKDALDRDATRRARDAAWSRHRAALDAATADGFAEAMARDDRAVDIGLAHGEELGQVKAERRMIADLERRLAAADAEAEAAAKAVAVAEARGREARRTLGVPEGMTAEELATWLDRAEAARRSASRLARERRRLKPELDARAAAAERLRGLLPDLAALSDAGIVARGRALHAGHERAVARRADAERALGRTRRNVEDRRRGEAKAQAALAAAREEWERTVAARLPRDHGLADPAAALEGLDEVSRTASSWRSVRRQADALRDDAEAYVAEVGRLAAALGDEAPAADDGNGGLTGRIGAALGCELRLQKRLEDAQAARRALTDIATEIDGHDKTLRAAEAAKAEAEAGIGLYRDRFAKPERLATVAEIEAAVAAAREATRLRRDLAGRRRALEALEARARGAGLDLDALEGRDLDAEREEAEVALRAAEDRRDEAARRHGAAEEALQVVDGADRIARLRLERATCEEELRDAALDYARKRLGLHLARAALDAYRREHRSALMQHAGDAFEALTRRRYSELTSRAEGAADVLVARCDEDGIVRRAQDMSEGTRMQLFFALRVAAYVARVERMPACPFIADDIFESFDDYRTEAACDQMRTLGRHGQAIYLTHHSEVAARAIKACGAEARIHFMPGVPEEDRARLGRAA